MLYLDGWDAELPRRVSGRPGIWLLDHGPIYMLTSLDEFGPSQTRSEACRRFRLEALRRWSSFLDLVVWLDTPNRILAERIEVRATDHRMKGEAEHEVVIVPTGIEPAERYWFGGWLSMSRIHNILHNILNGPLSCVTYEISSVHGRTSINRNKFPSDDCRC